MYTNSPIVQNTKLYYNIDKKELNNVQHKDDQYFSDFSFVKDVCTCFHDSIHLATIFTFVKMLLAAFELNNSVCMNDFICCC